MEVPFSQNQFHQRATGFIPVVTDRTHRRDKPGGSLGIYLNFMILHFALAFRPTSR
jgi:hypothetical protein